MFHKTRKMDLLTHVITNFSDPDSIDNIDILCYQRDVYEGIHKALESAERLGHNTNKHYGVIKLKIDKLNERIGQLSKENFRKRSANALL
jgi:hypothetical protein